MTTWNFLLIERDINAVTLNRKTVSVFCCHIRSTIAILKIPLPVQQRYIFNVCTNKNCMIIKEIQNKKSDTQNFHSVIQNLISK